VASNKVKETGNENCTAWENGTMEAFLQGEMSLRREGKKKRRWNARVLEYR